MCPIYIMNKIDDNQRDQLKNEMSDILDSLSELLKVSDDSQKKLIYSGPGGMIERLDVLGKLPDKLKGCYLVICNFCDGETRLMIRPDDRDFDVEDKVSYLVANLDDKNSMEKIRGHISWEPETGIKFLDYLDTELLIDIASEKRKVAMVGALLGLAYSSALSTPPIKDIFDFGHTTYYRAPTRVTTKEKKIGIPSQVLNDKIINHNRRHSIRNKCKF